MVGVAITFWLPHAGTLVTTFEELLKRTKAQVEQEANLKHRYWNGAIVKKSLEVPFEAEAHLTDSRLN